MCIIINLVVFVCGLVLENDWNGWMDGDICHVIMPV